MLNENFVYLGTMIYILGSIKYIHETIQGKIQPNRVTFFLWALAPLIAFAAEITQGVGLQSLLTFLMGFTPLMVFLVSFTNKKACWKLSAFDYICGTLSLIGLFLWCITQVGNLAILFAILADGLAALPTIKKAYFHPETENGKLYLASIFYAVIVLLTLKSWNFSYYAFPIYILVLCLVMTSLVEFRLGKIKST